ncbi:hypothetical protein [Methylomonas koyamae]|uniref:hypothetical protein n=1 Tax=Methylomonas koyamae TaxID=702114 RepID=UPI002873F044|nr:hypothetical protein [Methylomonas koyamae]WNB74031.1 hypothetical protein RI210_12115 [Methylomonas koyamae]
MYQFTKPTTALLPIAAFVVALTNINVCWGAPQDDQVPDLVGTWTGENQTYSEKKGYSNWNKTIEISEQKGRIFKGQFTYADGTKHFFGVIYPDNASFTWVAVDSKGYNQGRILNKNIISACYSESGADATVGCAELTKKVDKP